MVFECKQLLHCIGMVCIVRNDDVSFTRSRRVLYFIVLPPVSMQKFRLNVYMVYHRYKSSTATFIELRFFMKKMKMKNLLTRRCS